MAAIVVLLLEHLLAGHVKSPRSVVVPDHVRVDTFRATIILARVPQVDALGVVESHAPRLYLENPLGLEPGEVRWDVFMTREIGDGLVEAQLEPHLPVPGLPHTVDGEQVGCYKKRVRLHCFYPEI